MATQRRAREGWCDIIGAGLCHHHTAIPAGVGVGAPGGRCQRTAFHQPSGYRYRISTGTGFRLLVCECFFSGQPPPEANHHPTSPQRVAPSPPAARCAIVFRSSIIEQRPPFLCRRFPPPQLEFRNSLTNWKRNAPHPGTRTRKVLGGCSSGSGHSVAFAHAISNRVQLCSFVRTFGSAFWCGLFA